MNGNDCETSRCGLAFVLFMTSKPDSTAAVPGDEGAVVDNSREKENFE